MIGSWLKKLVGSKTEAPPPPRPAASAWPTPIPLQPRPAAPVAPAAPAVPVDAGDIELPLKPILEKLPPDIREKLTMPIETLGDASMSIPASQILPQLASGVVRIDFGHLRGAASTLFDVGGEFDSIAITLPLDVVLSRLNRRMLARDPAQKKVDQAKEIGSVFLRRSDVIASPSAAPKPAAPAPTAPSTETQIRLKMPAAPAAAPIAPISPAPKAPATPPAAPPAAPIRPTTPLPPPPAPAPIAMKPTAPPAPSSIPFSPSPIASTPPKPAPAAAPAAAKPAAAPDPEPNILTLPLSTVMDKWPDALKNEIVQRDLGNSKLALPMGALEEGMKRGIVTLFWRDVRVSLRPPVADVSVHDGVALEIPLKVIAPLFVAKHAATARPKANVAVDKSIPNVFENKLAPKLEAVAPTPVAPPAPVAPPVAAAPSLKMAPAAPVAPPPPPAPSVAPATPISAISTPAPAPSKPEESTGFAPRLAEPQGMDSSRKRPATPTDLIRRTMELKGVEGSMIVLHDGLMVASELPPYLNPETAAAFLPQIYDRLSQCIGELRMGPLSHLRFNVGSVTWHVYRQPSVYFAVFGRDGELPPDSQLATLAAELDRTRQ